MDLANVLRQLHEELQNLDAAILSLERLQASAKRPSRPAGWLTDLHSGVDAKPKRKSGKKSKDPPE
jgi:hypothetical protein